MQSEYISNCSYYDGLYEILFQQVGLASNLGKLLLANTMQVLLFSFSHFDFTNIYQTLVMASNFALQMVFVNFICTLFTCRCLEFEKTGEELNLKVIFT